MKARIKATGEIVEVYPDNGVFRSKRTTIGYEWKDLDFEPLPSSFDWESFRNETAAKLMQSYVLATMSTEKTALAFIKMDKSNNPSKLMAEMAIQQTDELIKQLKSKL